MLVRRLDPDLPLPAYAHPGDAGADLMTAEDVELAPGERAMVPTGVAIALPDGYAAFVHPRSGLAHRFGVGIVNAPGTVDAGYRGEIKVLLVNHDPHRHRAAAPRRPDRPAGRAAGRAGPVPRGASVLPGSARGEGGHGSTGGFADRSATPRSTRQSHDRGVNVFRKKRGQDDDDDADDDRRRSTAVDDATSVDDVDERRRRRRRPAARGRAHRGPFDVSEVDDPAAGGRVDLGGLWLPGRPGLEVRIEADQKTGEVVAVTLVLGEGALQVQPFAAPRSEGIWDEVRAEIRAGITQQGGTADEVEGPLGTELRTKVPVRAADGSQAVQPARFLGVDGPRWFLRGVLTGRPARRAGHRRRRWSRCSATSSWCAAARRWRRATRSRCGCRPPTVPGRGAPRTTRPRPTGDLKPFERGPEITEIH